MGQVTWEKIYYRLGGGTISIHNARTDIKLDAANKKYMFTGMSSNSYLLEVYELDSNGVMVERKTFKPGTNTPSLKYIKNTKEVAVFSLEAYSAGVGTAYHALFKLDSTYNITWKLKFLIDSVSMGNFEELYDGSFLMVCNLYTGFTNRPLIFKTDSSGNLIWTKILSNMNGLPRSALETIDGNYIIGINCYQGAGVGLVKTDTAGTVLWAKSYMRPQGVVVDMMEKPNGNLLLAGVTDTTFQTQYQKLYLTELDSAGNVLWTKAYGDLVYQVCNLNGAVRYFWPIRIHSTFDGGLILSTTMKLNGTSPDMVLLKLDINGNLEWAKRYGIVDAVEYGIDVIQTPDSGYFVEGGFYRPTTQIGFYYVGYYLLKTDALGMVRCSENADSIPVVSLVPTDSIISVTDSAIFVTQNISGIHDTVISDLDTLPNCITLSVMEFNSFYYTPIAYPNPNSGSFHLKMPEGMQGEKNIFIYDLTGREVSSTLHTFQTEFDFTLTAKGVYLVKVADAKRTIVVKVVVM